MRKADKQKYINRMRRKRLAAVRSCIKDDFNKLLATGVYERIGDIYAYLAKKYNCSSQTAARMANSKEETDQQKEEQITKPQKPRDIMINSDFAALYMSSRDFERKTQVYKFLAAKYGLSVPSVCNIVVNPF